MEMIEESEGGTIDICATLSTDASNATTQEDVNIALSTSDDTGLTKKYKYILHKIPCICILISNVWQ